MKMQELSAEQLEQLYSVHMESDFPADELKPLKVMLERYEQGICRAFGYFDGSELTAYAVFMQPEPRIPFGRDSYVLLDYYAVCGGLRGKGIGSAFLGGVLESLTDCAGVLLEVEDPKEAKDEEELTIRTRRIRFYERLGCRMIPDLLATVFGVRYRILVWEKERTEYSPEKAAEGMRQVYRSILPEEVYRKNVDVRSGGL